MNSRVIQITFISCLFFILFYMSMGTFEYQEANYFITRVNFLFYDMTPYSDFEYAYGLLYLYTPLLFKNVGLSTEISYLISYILFFILGNYMLYSIMSYLNIKKYFLFITLIYLNFSFGLNYNIIRFVISYYFIIIMYQQYLIYENSFYIILSYTLVHSSSS